MQGVQPVPVANNRHCCQTAVKEIAKNCRCTHTQCWPSYVYTGVVLGTMVGIYVLQDKQITAGVVGLGFITTLALSCILNRPAPEPADSDSNSTGQNMIENEHQLVLAEEGRAKHLVEEDGKVADELSKSIVKTLKDTNTVRQQAQSAHRDMTLTLHKAEGTTDILDSIRDDDEKDD